MEYGIMEYYSAKQWTTGTSYNMEESQQNNAEWKKQDQKKKEYKSFI